jgi:hypothetical protein
VTPSLDVRYPVGRFDFKDPFRSEDRPLFLAQLAEEPAKLRAAVAGLSDSQLDTPYRPGGWTLRQLVHHLADAQVIGTFAPSWPSPKTCPSRSLMRNNSGPSLPTPALVQ